MGGSLRVLVVDDNKDNADSFAMILKLTGHEVQVAYDGEQALAIAAENQFHAIMLDLGMPQINGYELAKQLRAHPCCTDSWIIAVTGYADVGHRVRCVDAGFDHYLVKPVEPAHVVAILRQPRGNAGV